MPHVQKLHKLEGLGRLNGRRGGKRAGGQRLHLAQLAQELLDVRLLGGHELAGKGEGFAVEKLCLGEARILLGHRT